MNKRTRIDLRASLVVLTLVVASIPSVLPTQQQDSVQAAPPVLHGPPTHTSTPRPILTTTVTLTMTATVTLSATPTDTPTITATPTHTATATPTSTPTLTPTPTITPTPTPYPVYVPLILRQVKSLLDGGFESGAFQPAWEVSGNLPTELVAGQSHEGEYAALLGNPNYNNAGGCPTGVASISQVIDVPTDGRVFLRFWYRIYSYDTLDFDYFAVYLRPASGGAEEKAWFDGRIHWNNSLWNSGWREGVVLLDRYRGQRVQVRLCNVMSNADGWYNTWTLVDDVSVTVQR
jgi:hypothetical protein